MKKKLLSLALALVMCLSLVPSALAADEYIFVVQKDSPYKTVDDLKNGAKIWVPKAFADDFAKSGFNVVDININDRYLAFQQGLVDAVFVSREYDFPKENWMRSLDAGPAQQPAAPAAPAASKSAAPTNDKLEVNGTAANPTVYKIGDSNYFKIRDVAALLNGTEKQFSVGYDSTLNSVTATTGQGYEKQPGDLTGAATGGSQNAETSNDTIYVNGQKVDAEVYKINGSNYFKLRDLGKALNFYVGWSAERGMYIETANPYAE